MIILQDLKINKNGNTKMVKKETPNNDYVKTSTLFGAVALALVIGFIAGAVFSFFAQAHQQTHHLAPMPGD